MGERFDRMVRVSDGAELAVRVHLPIGPGPFPTLFAASPYRFDNDDLPDTKMFLWRETGPIAWYVAQGYAYVRLDVRGSGRSGGDYEFYGPRERRDYYEIIEWAAAQPWSTGRVGGIGESYYGTAQWCMAAEKPPHLACIAPYDGHVDIYNGWAYPGGVPSDFMSLWWNNTVRPINRAPLAGPPRHIPFDLSYEIGLHPTFDEFWRRRVVAPLLDDVTIPVFSIGVWAKMDLHLGGNIRGWEAVKGPKWLMVTGAPNAFEACAEFEAVPFHRDVLAPFYDRFLKGLENGFERRAPVEVHVRGADRMERHATWPPRAAGEQALHLADGAAGHVRSLNDGRLTADAPSGAGCTSYDYPREHWAVGVVKLDAHGPDPLAEILTFTSEPLSAPLAIRGPCEFVAHLESTARDTDLIVRVTHVPADGGRPAVITKGWLRASHRALDERRSKPRDPVLTHTEAQPLTPGAIHELRVPLMHAAYDVPAGSRIRIEIANGDSLHTDPIFSHTYTPDKVGRDTLHHSPERPSRLLLTVV
ncbi:MAG TPA: CocE/NonD family hydrolase [Beijerinckiaceae bacterium]